MSDLLKKEEAWTVSIYTNQLVPQLTYQVCKLVNSKDPEGLTEIIRLINQYEERVKKYIE